MRDQVPEQLQYTDLVRAGNGLGPSVSAFILPFGHCFYNSRMVCSQVHKDISNAGLDESPSDERPPVTGHQYSILTSHSASKKANEAVYPLCIVNTPAVSLSRG